MATEQLLPQVSVSGNLLMFGGARVTWRSASARQVLDVGLAAHAPQEYQGALAALLPSGPAWPRAESVLQSFLGALAQELARVDERAVQLWAQMDPGTISELLSEAERAFGLPDPCVTTVQTVAERRAALRGRMTELGGQSRRFFRVLAASLGYQVTIEEFTSAAAATAAGIEFTGSGWAHTWRVNVPTSVGVTPFRAGAGCAGEPLRVWGNEMLECRLNRCKPAHTRLLFAYTATP